MLLGDLRRQLVVSRDDRGHLLRVRLPQRRRTLDVGEHERDHAGGERRLARGLETVDELRRRAWSPRRVGIERATQDTVEPLGELGRHTVPRDRLARLGFASGEQRDDRLRESADVVGDVGSRGVPQRGGAEHEHRGTSVGDDDVAGTHVAVDHTRLLRVEVVQRGRDVGQPAEDGRYGEPRRATLVEQRGGGAALDPVDHQHVAVVEHDVVPHRRHRGMGLQPEEQATLGEERRGIDAGLDVGDLEGDGAVVPTVEATRDIGAGATPQHLEHVVAVADHVAHRSRVYGSVLPPRPARRRPGYRARSCPL